ncbi:G5 domain-containing protein [Cellulomonas sp. NPDC089187]|uniref:G5 domain-containing protein n=1 Tax=Cellulomonas sp. NPDC089187 TaxID=3154970 RepID=UPI003448F817
MIAAATAVVVLASGGVAVADAHKTVTLDVDGVLTTVSTFSGSVDGLLAEQGLDLGTRDTVTPTGALRDGVAIEVRHAHQIVINADGTEQQVWTTALTADEALTMLASRGGDVRLVANRSNSGRPDLSLDLTLDGPAQVQVDGQTHAVDDGSTTVAEALDHLGVELQPLDRVGVTRAADGTVTVIVNRVVVQDVTTTSEVPFAATEQQDPSLYTGTTKVTTAGVPGVRTLVERVTTVDGAETGRETLSDEVTQAPVDQVTNVGTKTRPAPAPSTGGGSPAVGGGDAASLNWGALAACESGGNPTIVSANGKYHGLYQFSVGTWQSVGGTGLPSQASAAEQTARAQMLYNRSGAGQWPHCGPRLFS